MFLYMLKKSSVMRARNHWTCPTQVDVLGGLRPVLLDALAWASGYPAGLDADAQAAAEAAAAAVKKLSKTDKEGTLRQLVADGWLRHSQQLSGHYCIGVRAQIGSWPDAHDVE